MGKSKALFWSLLIIGILDVGFSVYSGVRGENFGSYFWGGFCGLTLIVSAFLEWRKHFQA